MKYPQSGYALLEVLVAFSIASISVTVILQSISTGLLTEATSKNYAQAVEVATSVLALADQDNLTPGNKTGNSTPPFKWQRSIERYPAPDIDYDYGLNTALIPYKVEVTVWWHESKGRRSFTLTTLRLAQKQHDV